jgi:hypothetical protein
MPRYANDKEVEIVHADWWAEGEEVAIRRLSYGEDQAIMKQCTRVDLENRLTTVDYAEYRVKVMARCIVWSKDGAEESKHKLSEADVRSLIGPDGEYIWEQLAALNERRDAAAQASFRGTPGGGTADPEGAS